MLYGGDVVVVALLPEPDGESKLSFAALRSLRAALAAAALGVACNSLAFRFAVGVLLVVVVAAAATSTAFFAVFVLLLLSL